MPQKLIKYLLIGGVSLVWGLIIYRIVDAKSEETPDLKSSVNLLVKDTVFEKFTLNADYPDPFLPDTASIHDSAKVADFIIQAPAQKIDIPKPDLSFIEYHGMIYNPSKKVKVGLVRLNGKELLIREKEEIGEVEIKRIAKNVLTILFKGQNYQINKE